MSVMEDDPKNFSVPAPGGVFFAGWIVAIVVALIATAGLVLARELWIGRQTSALEEENQAGPHVLVSQVLQAPATRDLKLPATIRGFAETDIYAKVPGYLKTINVDKGDRIHTGQVLAILTSPELDQQVANARANYNLALITDKRNQTLVHEKVIPQQTADESHGAMLQARATLKQYIANQQYETITAPFDKDGDPATITAAGYAGQKFTGTITRHPEALSPDTRTMLVEVDLPNDDLALYPGMYATAEFTVAMGTGAPTVPDDALVFRDGKVYVPVVRNNQLHLAEVVLGYDNGQMVEVESGISA